MGTRNTLVDLNNTLFEQLERINDADVGELDNEIRRGKAICGIASAIISNANTMVDAMRFKDNAMDATMRLPRVLTGGE